MDKHSVVRKVILFIQNNIENGSWKIDSRIPSEKEICEITKTSRTSVRSAISQLNILGLLETRHGSGTYVLSTNIGLLGSILNDKTMSTKEEIIRLIEWNEARLILEPMVTYYATEKATPEFIARLEEINKLQRSAVGNQKEFIEADLQFHLALSDFIGNEYVSNAIRSVLNSDGRSSMVNYLMGYHGGVYFHAAITDAIRKKDSHKAMEMMKEHAEDRLEGIKNQLKILE